MIDYQRAAQRRTECLGDHLFFVVSAAGPLLAMAGGVPVSMLFGNGAGIPAMFLAAMLILCVFSVGYTKMARHVRNAGAFYAIALEGLGTRAGGASGMIALLSYNALQISLYGMFGTAADSPPWPRLRFSAIARSTCRPKYWASSSPATTSS